MSEKHAIIIGAGPAGLTAAYELLTKTAIKPIVFEMTGDIGGISKTVNYKGNRIDIGGHRFFSKSDRVMQWWQNIMALQGAPSRDDLVLNITYQNQVRAINLSANGPDPEKTDAVMLVRSRLSRIFFLRKFFDYPISLSLRTIRNLGIVRMIRIGFSYLKARLTPIKPEVSLEDFFINRFGKELYRTFFKDYTEKVWGVPCHHITAEWGAQRIKGLSITKTLLHALKSFLPKKKDISQKNIETSLIEEFLYPKLGPGQMWETVAELIRKKGGEIHLHQTIAGVEWQDQKILALQTVDTQNGLQKRIEGDYFFSTMPVKDLISAMGIKVPAHVQEVARGLLYRDFITVGLLLTKLKINNETAIKTVNNLIPDNWIYIQEREVKVGRLQIFNNWSPYMVKDPNTVWIGLEYFCNEGDDLWSKADPDFIQFAVAELAEIDVIEKNDVLDATILRVPKTYPAYFGSYEQFSVIREFVDNIANLFLIGRNGMHRYNNQDHSMLTAITAVENIMNGVITKDNIWSVNTEQEFHEEK